MTVLLVAAAVAALAWLPWLLVGLAMPRLGEPTPVEDTRVAALRGGTIRYQDEGSGDTALVLLHGFNEGLGRWDDVWRRLERCPVRRVRVDLPGFGGSTWSTDDFGLPAQSARLLAFFEHLGLRRVTLVGTSMGGSLGAWVAAASPERVAQLALLAPSGYPDALHHPGLYGALIRPGPLNRAATWLARTAAYRAVFPHSAALQALTVSASYGRPWAEALPGIRAPTFLAWSRSDATASAGTARAVADAISQSTLFWLGAEAGHGIPSTRPEFTAEVACRLAQGTAPDALADALPPEVLRPGDGEPAREGLGRPTRGRD